MVIVEERYDVTRVYLNLRRSDVGRLRRGFCPDVLLRWKTGHRAQRNRTRRWRRKRRRWRRRRGAYIHIGKKIVYVGNETREVIYILLWYVNVL